MVVRSARARSASSSASASAIHSETVGVWACVGIELHTPTASSVSACRAANILVECVSIRTDASALAPSIEPSARLIPEIATSVASGRVDALDGARGGLFSVDSDDTRAQESIALASRSNARRARGTLGGPMIELDLSFMDERTLREFLREQVLRRRAFVFGVRDVPAPTPCALLCVLAGSPVKMRGEIVFVRDVEPGAGVGVQLEPLPLPVVALIESFLLAAAPEPEMATRELLALNLPLPDMPEPPASVGDEPAASEGEPIEEPERAIANEPEAQALHVRMRSLTSVEQRRVALTGNLAERVMLERMYGPNVWEALLSSGRLSPPEVATIARKGTLPRPLVEAIAANAGWLASGEVQRALLSNPRSSAMVVAKVLRMMPKHELARVPMQTAYPASVRQAAKEMVKR